MAGAGKGALGMIYKSLGTTALTTTRSTSTALMPYVAPSTALVRSGHRFVTPTVEQLSGIRAGFAEHSVIPKGAPLYQSQPPGGYQGRWYSRKPSDPWASGISPVGVTSVLEHGPGGAGLPPLTLAGGAGIMHQEGGVQVKLARKTTQAYRVTADVPAMISTAAAIRDTWSMNAFGLSTMTSGGAEQLLIPDRSHVAPVEEPLTRHQFRRSRSNSNRF